SPRALGRQRAARPSTRGTYGPGDGRRRRTDPEAGRGPRAGGRSHESFLLLRTGWGRGKAGVGARTAHTGRLVPRSQPALCGGPREPSAFCSLYSYSILLKLRLTCSTGVTLVRLLPPVWNEDTSRSVMWMRRYSCCSLPALRTVRTAFRMCSPLAQASISLGEALLAFMVKWKSFMLTLPARPPPLLPCVPICDSLQLQVSSSIAPGCL